MEKDVVQALVQARFTNIGEVAEGKISFNLVVIVTARNFKKGLCKSWSRSIRVIQINITSSLLALVGSGGGVAAV